MNDESDHVVQAWKDYHARQQFEHLLIDRKTVWMLTAQGLLFTAYGIAASAKAASEATRGLLDHLPTLGVLLSLLSFVGVGAVINSKRKSWLDYRAAFGGSVPPFVPLRAWPERIRGKDRRLPWGVRTSNTVVSLLPDLLYPAVVAVVWILVARAG